MKLRNITKPQIGIIIFSILYSLMFAVLFIVRKDYEFLWYLLVLIIIALFIGFLHLRFNLSSGALLGLSTWGFLHLSGGYFVVNGDVLYNLWIGFLKYDMIVHAYGFGFATLSSYYILKNYLIKKNTFLGVSIFLVLIGMGLGSLNEIVEFMAVLSVPNTNVGDYYNNAFDLVFNTIGAIIAVLYINFKIRKN